MRELDSCIGGDKMNQYYEQFPNISEITRNSTLGVNIKLHKAKLNLIYLLTPYCKDEAKRDIIDFLDQSDVETFYGSESAYSLQQLKKELENDDYRYK